MSDSSATSSQLVDRYIAGQGIDLTHVLPDPAALALVPIGITIAVRRDPASDAKGARSKLKLMPLRTPPPSFKALMS